MKVRLKSFIRGLFIALLTLLLGLLAALFLFKDRIIARVLAEVNKSLQVPVQVDKVDLELLHGFPNIAVRFNDVVVPADSDSTFLEAGKIYALLNPFALLRGELIVARIEVADARITIHVDKQNKNNISALYRLQRQGGADSTAANPARIKLHSMLLKNVDVSYTNLFTGTRHHWLVEQLLGDFSLQDNVYAGKIKGSLSLQDLLTRTWRARRQRKFILTANVRYDNNLQQLQVIEAGLQNEGATLTARGELNLGAQPSVDLTATGDKVTLALLASYLPPKYEQKLKEYKSKGSIDFAFSVKGNITKRTLPALQGRLQLNDVDLTNKEFKANINKLFMVADIAIDDIGNLATGRLTITSASGLLDNNPFSFGLTLNNFVNPHYKGNFKGTVTTQWLLADAGFPDYQSGSGTVAIDLQAAGKYGADGTLEESAIGGSFKLNEVAFKWSDPVAVEKISGIIQLNGNSLSLSNMQLRWRQSDMVINGSVADISKVLANTGGILLIADVKSHNLVIEDIVALISTAPDWGAEDTVTTAGNYVVNLQLACRFDKLSFRRFRGRKVAGEVTFEEDLLEVIDLTGRSMGGATRLTGKLKFMPNKDIYISADANTRGVHLDSLFYVFHNFQQDFITDKHLKGKLYADITASMYFDSAWHFKRPLLTSRARVKVVGGELNGFAPIMALSAYINDKEDNLSRLRFSDLTNYITIKEDTVFIPEMSIQTNVRNIALAGYHTLDQHINYRLAVPVISERVDKDTAFGTIQKSAKGVPNLLFKIKGTTEDYKVNYDLKRATGNVLRLLNITRIFKQKEVEPVDSSFLDEEEFDWEN